jgi:hypothetical protein
MTGNKLLFLKIKLVLLLLLPAQVAKAQVAKAQEVLVELGPTQLPITEYFTISLKLRGIPPKAIGDFPEIEGFQKSNRTITRSRITADRRTFIEETITQNYAALQEGSFVLKPFTIAVNGKLIASPGKTIRVDPEPEQEVNPEVPPGKSKTPAVAPLPEQAPKNSLSFLALESNRAQVWMGEGVAVRLFFYLAAEDQGYLDFHDFASQFEEITKSLKQTNVWEENFEVNSTLPDTLALGNKTYLRFPLAASIYYPFGNKDLHFPPVSLTMVKWPKEQGFAAGSNSQSFITFTSKPAAVVVRRLPAHPGRETVQVGDYRLHETIDQAAFRTGKSFTYSFTIAGTGNLNAFSMPEAGQSPGLEIFPPLIQFRPDANRQGSGRKTFKYTIIASKPGRYELGKRFAVPFFNPVSGQYDTLRSELSIRVAGIRDLPPSTRPEETHPFYKLIATESNVLTDINKFKEIKLYTNLVILFLICASLYVFYKK